MIDNGIEKVLMGKIKHIPELSLKVRENSRQLESHAMHRHSTVSTNNSPVAGY